jgi:hypothetical protein
MSLRFSSRVALLAALGPSLVACGARSDLPFSTSSPPVTPLPPIDVDGGIIEPGPIDAGPPVFDGSRPVDASPPIDAAPPQDASGSCFAPPDAAGTPSALLFGGSDILSCNPGGPCNATTLGDTWLFRAGAWVEQSPPQAPPPRSGHAMTSWGTGALLFGGYGMNAQNPLLKDTWQWDGHAWQLIPKDGPPARAYATLGAVAGLAVLFGGIGVGHTLGDTWVWDGCTWTQAQGTSPPARANAAMTELEGRVILQGGSNDTGALSDTWAWDVSGWTQLASGPTEVQHAMATLGSNVVLYGYLAAMNGTAFPGTAIFDGTSWTPLQVAGPPLRQSPAMATADSEVVLFGGLELGQTASIGDTWIWNGGAWTELDIPSPQARWEAAMVSCNSP